MEEETTAAEERRLRLLDLQKQRERVKKRERPTPAAMSGAEMRVVESR